MIIDHELLDSLSAKAKASPRLRMNFDLRDSPKDGPYAPPGEEDTMII